MGELAKETMCETYLPNGISVPGGTLGVGSAEGLTSLGILVW